MKVRAQVVFRGHVQGVFFRANTKACAERFALTGWVRNRSDGSVEAVFEGEKDVVDEAIDWCTYRQPYARVESRSIDYSAHTGEYEGFMVV